MNIRGVNLNVQIYGEGVPFIWGHGLLYSVEIEDQLISLHWKDLPAGVQLVRYDARGHGKSQASFHPQDYHFRNLALDMLAIAGALNINSFIAGGVSLGCMTSIYAALEYPERIKAMVLMLPGTAWQTRIAQARRLRLLALIGLLVGGSGLSRVMNLNSSRTVPAWMVNQAVPLVGYPYTMGLKTMKRRTLWNLFRGVADSDLPPHERLSALAGIPCLIVSWVGDRTHPVSSAEELHRLLPASELFIGQDYEGSERIYQYIHRFVRNFAMPAS